MKQKTKNTYLYFVASIVIIISIFIVYMNIEAPPEWVENTTLTSQYNALNSPASYYTGQVQCIAPLTYWRVYTKESEDYVKVCSLDFEPGNENAVCEDAEITVTSSEDGIVLEWLSDGFVYDPEINTWINNHNHDADFVGWSCQPYSLTVLGNPTYKSVKLYSSSALFGPDNRDEYAKCLACGIFVNDQLEFCGDFKFPWEE